MRLTSVERGWEVGQRTVNVVPIPDALIVNLGDQFACWTNNIFKSTVHRAMNCTGVAHYSIPLFFGMDYNVPLKCANSGTRNAGCSLVLMRPIVETGVARVRLRLLLELNGTLCPPVRKQLRPHLTHVHDDLFDFRKAVSEVPRELLWRSAQLPPHRASRVAPERTGDGDATLRLGQVAETYAMDEE
ncbi:hypothetical protein EI94DRAFT_1805467 [Lactarius quietus]|nr:hypothetical protein EI94DRAFT_1805467 [Lactarius quietus]